MTSHSASLDTLRITFTHEHCWPYVRRGGERIMHELAASLVRRGHEVTIVAGAPEASVAVEDGVRVLRFQRRTESLADRSRFAASLIRQLLREDADVVHSFGPRDANLSIHTKRVRADRLTVYTNLGLPVKAWWDEQPTRRAHARVVSDVDVYGCLSKFGVMCLERDYGRKGSLTPGGVSLKTFRPIASRASDPTILYSGVLDDPRKGVSSLLQAVSILAAREPRLNLWLVGPGDPTAILDGAPLDAQRRTTVLERSKVHLGTPEYQVQRYSAAWITALPSIGEALGVVLLESLACGTPIVASDDAGSKELVRPDIGALTKPLDPDSLAVACEAALNVASIPSSRTACREAARQYDWDAAIAPRLELLYSSATG